MIKILGLGPGSDEDITIKTMRLMKEGREVILRTEKHPNVKYIRDMGIEFSTLDYLYDSAESFETLYEKISEVVISKEDVVYAVPGNPLVAEKSVELVIQKAKEKGIEYEVVPAISFVDVVINSVNYDPVKGLKIIDGLTLSSQRPDIGVGNIITQVYSRMVASDIKLQLMRYYEDDQKIYIIRAAGVPGEERVLETELYNLDRYDWVDYLTSVFIPPVLKGRYYTIDDLTDVMTKLRSQDGCPWDREQDHNSLKRYLLEECYEVIDAIDKDDTDALCEELGDVLLQVVFHSEIANEEELFDINDVINSITNKMIMRHTHVFGNDVCSTSEEVLKNWEEIKRKEKSIESYTDNLKAIPKVMPSLIRSYKVQEKAAKVGFDWDKVEDAIEKVKEEFHELLDVYKSDKKDKITEELGDLLFSVVNVSRFLDINPEFALNGTTDKFISRFGYIEGKATESGMDMKKMTLEQMDNLWNKAKEEL